MKGFVRGAAGEIDTTFGKDGVVALDEDHNAITMRADGSFWVLENAGGHVRMYTKDGVLDPSFATAGIYTANSSQPVNALAWKAPYLHLGVGLPGNWRVTRMNPDGQLDTTYGVGGIYSRTHGSPSPLAAPRAWWPSAEATSSRSRPLHICPTPRFLLAVRSSSTLTPR